ncbi:biotin-dependent carboxyltransferase family protein [Campylobacter jejuni]|nr:biotin-dependent carboxyltransferase family protein [Campylobacter jejuni]KJD23663.1 allophanate hydrolase [Campylobacter jejuni subsp. jejuni]ECO6469020.1 biotin-dependent carboxyltransferase family protein [Campylobacter jejuni]EDP5894490.1 biotin-dependent carboxyltransferase family protein [Campylobacter jejuni]EIA7118215.1 biotin-dependent carboxyltransferase family protein [Campylobacter jejuni]
MSIKIIEAFINSSLQDFGRKKFAKFGIARSGAMDEDALRMTNILLGNKQDEAGIELCLKGGKYKFLDENYFVLSGAEFEAKPNNQKIKTCKVYKTNKGDILELGLAKIGFRGHLCVASSFEVKSFLNSKSSDAKMRVGIFKGRALQKDDILNTHNTFIPFNLEARECENPIFKSSKDPIIRVILGTNKDVFTQKGIDAFLNTSYKVGLKSDRMVIYTESSKSIEHKNSTDIISDPAVFGSIQVPKSGIPIILMAVGQSIGDYTKIATVIENDLSFFAINIDKIYSTYSQGTT